jgi:hypothetical protein
MTVWATELGGRGGGTMNEKKQNKNPNEVVGEGER